MDEMSMMCHSAVENATSGLLDTIDSQQQEIKQLKFQNETLRAQLAQCREALKNLIDSINDANDDFENEIIEYSKTSLEMEEARDYLSSAPADYHNPADANEIKIFKELVIAYIENTKKLLDRENQYMAESIISTHALRLAREALSNAKYCIKTNIPMNFQKTNKEIDEAIAIIEQVEGKTKENYSKCTTCEPDENCTEKCQSEVKRDGKK